MSYYFECETRNIGNGATRPCDYEVIETVDMDIFLEFLMDYHEEKWRKNSWEAVMDKEWINVPLGDLSWRRARIRAFKRYVEHAFDSCFHKKCKVFGTRSPMYKAYSYFIKANYNQ